MSNDLPVEDSPAYKKLVAELARWDALSETYKDLEAQALALKKRFQDLDHRCRAMQHAARAGKAVADR